MTTSAGRRRANGAAALTARSHVRRRRRRNRGEVPAAIDPFGTRLLDNETRAPIRHDYPFRVDVMFWLANVAACLTVSFPVRIWVSMLRRTLPLSMLTQFFAVGTNQLFAAARSVMLDPSRLVAFGPTPFDCRTFMDAVSVKSLIQSIASALSVPTGTARLEPPRKTGIDFPGVWLGITNCFETFAYLSMQQVTHDAPGMAPTRPWA